MYCIYQNQGPGPITFGLKSCDKFYNMTNEKFIGFTIYHQWKIFIIDFSGTTKVVKLKLGTHMDSGLMCCVYKNQGQGSLTLSYIP